MTGSVKSMSGLPKETATLVQQFQAMAEYRLEVEQQFSDRWFKGCDAKSIYLGDLRTSSEQAFSD